MTSKASRNFETWGLIPLRLVIATVFLMHGSQKIFDFGVPGVQDMLTKLGFVAPGFFAVVLIVIEPLGAVAILCGLFTRAAGLILAVEMAIAIYVARLGGGFFTPYGFEFEMTLLGGLLTLAAVGAGGVSIDAYLERRRLATAGAVRAG